MKREEQRDLEAELYRQLSNSCPLPVLVLDRNGVIASANPAFYEITNFEPAAIVGRAWPRLRVIPIKNLTKYLGFYTQILKDNIQNPYHFEIMKKDGNLLQGKAFVSAVRDKDGQVVAVQVIFQEITESEILLEKLKKYEGSLREFFEDSLVAIVSWDAQGYFTFVNKAYCRLTHYDKEELIGKHLESTPVYKIPQLKRTFQQVLKSKGPETVDLELLYKDGTKGIARAIITALKSGGKVTQVWALFLDVTEERKLEHELEAQVTLNKSLFHAIPYPIFYKDAEGRYIGGNKTFSELILGLPPEKYIGKKEEELSASVPAKVKELSKKQDRKLLKTGGSQSREETITCADGQIREFMFYKSVLKNMKNKTIGVMGIMFDVTEKNMIERELRESEERYRVLVENSPTAVVVHSGGIVVYANPVAVELLGAKKAEDILGKPVMSFVHIDYLKGVKKRIDNIYEKRKPAPIQEELFLKMDGTPFFVEVLGEAISYQGKPSVLVLFRDIGARRQMEQALIDSEARFRNIVNTSPMGMHLYTVDDRKRLIFTGANPAAEKILKFNHSTLVGKEISQAFPNIKDTEVPQRYLEAALEGKIWHTEQIDYQDDRITGAFEVYAFQTWPGAMAALFLEVTGRIRGREELQRERDLVSGIMETSPVGITVVDSDGRIIFANNRAEKILGMKKEEINQRYYNSPEWHIGDLNGNLIADSDLPFSVVMRTGKPLTDYQHIIQWSNGKIIYLSVSGTPLENREGKIEKVVFSIEDVSHRYHLENMLRRLIEASNYTGILFFTEITKQISTGLNLEYVFVGKLSDSEVGKMVTVAFCANGEKQDNFEYDLIGTPCETALAQPLPQSRSHFRMCHFYSGVSQQYPKSEFLHKMKIESYVGVPLYNSRNRALGIVAAMGTHPVEDPYLVEATLPLFANRIASELERLQVEEERELIEKQLQRAQKIESIGRLAGGVAHDFNNMLMPIIGYAELMLHQETEISTEMTHQLNEILDAARRAKELTQQLLAFGRKQMLQLSVVDINDLIYGFLGMLRRIIRENIQIKFVPDSKPCAIEADPSQIEQIVLNLALNAQDAMPDGGEFIIESQHVTVDDVYLRTHTNMMEGDYILIVFSDTGHGMESSVREKIFEPFFTTKSLGEGTGLGLATVYGIVKQHMGYIWVYSEINQGTTFKVYIPQAQKFTTKVKKRSETVRKSTKAYTVLLVEDDDKIREMLERALIQMGLTVYVAENSQKAQRIAQKHVKGIDLLLTDVIMPEMNGVQLYNSIRTTNPDLQVLYMSGYTENVIGHHGVLDKDINFIAKPFSLTDLLSTIERILKKK